MEYLAYFFLWLACCWLLDLWPFLPPYSDLREWPESWDCHA